jgi:hypothetical protein
MSTTMHHEHDDIYRLEIRRLLRQTDLARAEHALLAEITRVGPVKLLVVLNEFEGFERQGNWDHAAFYTEHGDSIARIAGFRKGPVEFFPEDATGEALAWLSA